MQGGTLGETSNYALVKALASGTPTIDRTRYEVGDIAAGDFRTFEGHLYSDKAPGLAFVTVPAYVVLRELGLRTSGDPTVALWALRLWGVVLPAVVLLLIARRLADRVSPGHGVIVAVVLGASTLILPFTTMLYSHVLTAMLLLASFALLWEEPGGGPRPWLPVGAGFAAGFAVTSEYQTALAAAVFGLYAIARAPRLRRGLAYGAGVALGLLPLLAYNQWAFGSPTHLSYFGDELTSGALATKLDPSLVNVLFTFVAMPGLLVLAPILACGLVGLASLYARGFRAEALAISLVVAAFTIYNASLPGIEYDAYTAGPRYLVPVLPLLAVPIALTFRRWPATVGALALVSTVLLSVMTASSIHSSTDRRWFHALVEREFPQTAASVAGVTGWYAIAPFFVALGAAAVFAALATRSPSPSPADSALAAFAVGAWAAVAAVAPNELTGRAATLSAYVSPLLVILAVVATLGTLSALARTRLVDQVARVGRVPARPR